MCNVTDSASKIATARTGSALPWISVVTPVFNGCQHIAEAIESVLSQEYPLIEYIIVDGGSTDGTMEIIRSYQERADFKHKIARVICEPDNGMYDALAKGFALSTGEIYCYLNFDGFFLSGALQSVGRYFADNDAVKLVYHEDIVQVDGWRFPNATQPDGVDTSLLLDGHILFQDGVFWRKSLYDSCGGIRRDLRLAGDYDLWLRMSAHARFVKRPGHVSCFRVRDGQLSTQMELYHAEVKQSRADFISSASFIERTIWKMKKLLRSSTIRSRRIDRLCFPMDTASFPPPRVQVPVGRSVVPRSPIDGGYLDRFLFSLPDTRFGDRRINDVYLDTRHGIAVVGPAIDSGELSALYRKYYSNPPINVLSPEGKSPYRKYNAIRGLDRFLLRFPVERFTNEVNEDHGLRELFSILESSGVNINSPLRFLDVGCFEADLMEAISKQKPWKLVGVEPNEIAISVARSKGHTVWEGSAERCVECLPQSAKFEVIHLGQSIEHVDNPVAVLNVLGKLLSPGGVIVLSTPNLDSREIDWFGPTWAHWHAPYHRYIFSLRGLKVLAERAGFLPIHQATFSNGYWTAMSLVQNNLGLGGSVSHAVTFDPYILSMARRIDALKRIIWNRLGRGDYCYVSMRAKNAQATIPHEEE